MTARVVWVLALLLPTVPTASGQTEDFGAPFPYSTIAPVSNDNPVITGQMAAG